MSDLGPDPANAPPAPLPIRIGFVLGDGSVISYRGQLGEVLRFGEPEQLLEALRKQHWMGVEITDGR